MTNDLPADVLTDLIGVLGDVLRVKPEKIDPEQTFQSLGLDSMLVVEFVAVVNTRYGLRVLATDLYDHPTPVSFAREVKRAAGGATADVAEPAYATAPAHASVPAHGPATTYYAPPASAYVPAPASASAYASVPPGGAVAAPQIAEVLREHLASILGCEAGQIDPAATFNVLGVDSIVGAEFIAVVNRVFGLRERSVLLYEHPSLAAMAAYVAARTGAAPTARPASLPAPEPAAPVRPLPVGDLDVLLDAVRDDRLTVDEAVLLLARRS
ncbi:phosphopantetheine-binding protein [Streptomyces sp. NPDC101206]|uniref:phosphopantetheine-binding protein n=1 Tax=Streptomyces sp. NPDC101206 TaxID=3366128 RepID=UPI00381FB093